MRPYYYVLVLILACSAEGFAQVRPINDYGALGLARLIKQMQTTASVMMIGAHPDDEDSALLAYLARGENARTAYLSLTRGDGGQNIIGPELFEPLGIIRTEELLQARRLDGAEQYFTRAFDYGFSKTLDEAKSKWDEKVVLCDAVRAIRLFRPLVVISRFTGTPRDGHGQHQFAGYVSLKAVAAAADPDQCSDREAPWKVQKFYVEQSPSDTSEPTLKIDTGATDPILGRTYFEIATEGRSQHRSQGEGRIEYHGRQFAGLNLVGANKDVRETSIFSGLDTSIKTVAALSDNSEPTFNERLTGLAAKIDDLKRSADISNPRRMAPLLAEIYELADKVEWSTRKPESKFYMHVIKRWAGDAVRIAAGIQIDALADAETVVPGNDLNVALKIFVAKDSPAKLSGAGLTGPHGWTLANAEEPTQNTAGFDQREVSAGATFYKVTVPRSASLTQPYWLVHPRNGDLFSWSREAFETRPFGPQPLIAYAGVNIDGHYAQITQAVQFRFADPARGELRREIAVVPSLSVAVDHALIVVPSSTKAQSRRLVVTVTNNTGKERSGRVSLNIAADPPWKVTAPEGSSFTLRTKGAKASVPFDITVPANTASGSVPIRASVAVGEAVANLTMNVVAYPHIQTHRYYTTADTRVETIDLTTVPVHVGYVMGSGDEVPEAIRQMGLKVTQLEEGDLSSSDLSKFDAIIVGIRASETRPDLVANNARLLDYARGGGTVIYQYQRGNWTGLAPFPVKIQERQGTAAGLIARVVDENAPVRILEPRHTVFNVPNKITEKDFEGWVQERNAYSLITFDPQYTALLESHDAGEPENKGGLVIAKVGKGNWVYCSYSFFRQLPAGVPGAYRLFANLLSLPRAK